MADNPKLRAVYQRKLLEFADLPPDEITEIMEYEKQKTLLPGMNVNPATQTGQSQTNNQQPMARQSLQT
jgi:hypothetical protein